MVTWGRHESRKEDFLGLFTGHIVLTGMEIRKYVVNICFKCPNMELNAQTYEVNDTYSYYCRI